MVGSRITTVAYPLLALRLTNSALAAGLVAFAATAPSLFVYVPAGALVDRLDPRRTMLLSEIGRGLAIGVVVLLLLFRQLSMNVLIAVAIIEESLEVVSNLAERVYVRTLIDPADEDEVTSAMAPIEARTHIVVLTGRPLGGFLFGITPILPFLADALSFAFSVGTLVKVKSKQAITARSSAISGKLRYDIGAGISWLFRDRYARATVILSSGATLVSQALIIVFLSTAHTHHLSSIAIGIVLAASGTGGVLGSVAAARWVVAPPWASLIQLQMLAWTLAFVILGASGGRYLPGVWTAMFILAFTGALGNVEAGSYLMRNVAKGMLARVTSINNLWSFGASAIGPVLGGLLMQRYGIEGTIRWLFLTTTFLALVSILTPSMQHRYLTPSALATAATRQLLLDGATERAEVGTEGKRGVLGTISKVGGEFKLGAQGDASPDPRHLAALGVADFLGDGHDVPSSIGRNEQDTVVVSQDDVRITDRPLPHLRDLQSIIGAIAEASWASRNRAQAEYGQADRRDVGGVAVEAPDDDAVQACGAGFQSYEIAYAGFVKPTVIVDDEDVSGNGMDLERFEEDVHAAGVAGG